MRLMNSSKHVSAIQAGAPSPQLVLLHVDIVPRKRFNSQKHVRLNRAYLLEAI